MPTINDPGLAVVRRAIERGLPVTCAPGPSAVLDALALSGLPTDRFCYEGFLPRKHSERVQYLRTMRVERRTMVFYETLHRIDESMADLLEAFGPDRPMALCRELTKEYEQVRRGTIGEIRQSVVDDPPRGEMVLVVGGASERRIRDGRAGRRAGVAVGGGLGGVGGRPRAGGRVADQGRHYAGGGGTPAAGRLPGEPQAGVCRGAGDEVVTVSGLVLMRARRAGCPVRA